MVTVNQESSHWVVLGRGADNAIVRIEGSLTDSPDIESRWPEASDESLERGWVQPIAASRTEVLMRRSRYHSGPFRGGYVASVLAPFTPAWTESEFWIAGNDGRRTLGTSGLLITCQARDAGGQPVCSAFAGDRTTLFALDLAGGRVQPTATLPGHFTGHAGGTAGWIAGRWDGDAVALRPGTGRGWRIRSGDDEWIRDVAANDRAIAIAATSGTKSVIKTYRPPTESR